MMGEVIKVRCDEGCDGRMMPHFHNIKAGYSRPVLVAVRWFDSWNSPTWQMTEDIKRAGQLVCESVGWLIHDGDDVLVLAATRGPEDGMEWAGTVTIPRGAVERRAGRESIELLDMPTCPGCGLRHVLSHENSCGCDHCPPHKNKGISMGLIDSLATPSPDAGSGK